MLQVGFEPTTSEFERAKTVLASDLGAAVKVAKVALLSNTHRPVLVWAYRSECLLITQVKHSSTMSLGRYGGVDPRRLSLLHRCAVLITLCIIFIVNLVERRWI
jgi:hypothetical protein